MLYMTWCIVSHDMQGADMNTTIPMEHHALQLEQGLTSSNAEIDTLLSHGKGVLGNLKGQRSMYKVRYCDDGISLGGGGGGGGCMLSQNSCKLAMAVTIYYVRCDLIYEV